MFRAAILLLALLGLAACGESDPTTPQWAVGSWTMNREDAVRIAEKYDEASRLVHELAEMSTTAEFDALNEQILEWAKTGQLSVLTLSNDGSAKEESGDGFVEVGTWTSSGDTVTTHWPRPVAPDGSEIAQSESWTLRRTEQGLVRTHGDLNIRYERGDTLEK